jgi:hypothetical protein
MILQNPEFATEKLMRSFVIIIFAALFSAPAAAESLSADCALARDPARCELRQAAIKSCAEERGSAAKQACIETALPPVDCTTASDPKRCEAIARAKEVCRDKTGKAQKACLKGEQAKKPKRKTTRSKPVKKTRPSQ